MSLDDGDNDKVGDDECMVMLQVFMMVVMVSVILGMMHMMIVKIYSRDDEKDTLYR